MLRRAATEGPDFAGHYKIAVWGCGSSCTDWGVINLATGNVTFAESLRAISGVHLGPEDKEPSYWGLRYERDSALLIVVGAPREDEKREGIAYYHWTGKSFELLRFVSLADICKRRHG